MTESREVKGLNKGLSDTEYEIMRLVWARSPEPALFGALQDALSAAGHPCHKNTLITLLGRLVNKGYLRADKKGRRNEYWPLITERQFQERETHGFVNRYYAGSAAGLMTTLVQADMLSEQEYAELRAILERYEK